MCGIAGFSLVPGSTIDVRRLGTNLLAASEKRGTAASGYAFVGDDGHVGYYKRDVPGSKLHIGRLPTDARAAIFHTRNWTQGSPTDNDNNHPLVSPLGTITLVHNGVIRNDAEIRSALGKTGKNLAEVDSAVIPALIEELGLEATDLLKGYAACAWFDTETGTTIHLARFKSSPVAFATLWDGSFVFASEPSILANALQKSGIAWFGSYPKPFEEMAEGQYFQILDGDILQESEVEWGAYTTYTSGETNWEEVTSGAKTRDQVVATPTTVNPAPATPVSTPGSVQRGIGFGVGTVAGTEQARAEGYARYEGGTVPKQIEAPKKTAEAKGKASAKKPGARARRRAKAEQGSSKEVIFSSGGSEDSPMALFGQDHADFTDPEGTGMSEADMAFLDQHGYLPSGATDGGFIPLFYSITHGDDYRTYTNLRQLIEDLRWNAGLSSEELLVGPDEGDLRWVNQFRDIGSVSEGGSLDTSWVEDSGTLDTFSNVLPSFVFDGIDKLRLLVGA